MRAGCNVALKKFHLRVLRGQGIATGCDDPSLNVAQQIGQCRQAQPKNVAPPFEFILDSKARMPLVKYSLTYPFLGIAPADCLR